MEFFKKWCTPALMGMTYAAALLLLSQLLLRNLAEPIAALASGMGLDGNTSAQVYQAFSQLRDAVIVSPWLAFLPIGAAAGFLLGLLPKKLKWICYVLSFLALIPGFGLAICFSRVNTILFIDLVRNVLPLVAAL